MVWEGSRVSVAPVQTPGAEENEREGRACPARPVELKHTNTYIYIYMYMCTYV